MPFFTHFVDDKHYTIQYNKDLFMRSVQTVYTKLKMSLGKGDGEGT